MEPESQNTEYLYDIFYSDKDRLISYLSQIDVNGLLTSLEVTSQEGNLENAQGEVNAGIAKGHLSSQSSNLDGTKRVYDPAAILPITVMDALDQKGFIGRRIVDSAIGSLVLSSGFMRIKDLSRVADMWPLMEKAIPFEQFVQAADAEGNRQDRRGAKSSNTARIAEIKRAMASIITNMEQPVQVEFITDNGFLWSTLKQESLFTPTADISLKHGSVIGGTWHILAILDCVPIYSEEFSRAAAEKAWNSLNDTFHLTDALNQVFSSVRSMFGRPDKAYGVTPLIIFRKTPLNKDGSRQFAEEEVARILDRERYNSDLSHR